LAFATVSNAAIILSSGSYSENFNGTIADATTVTAAFPSTIGTQAAIPGGSAGISGWDGVKRAGTGATGMNFVVDNGSGNSGALYSYGSTISAAAVPDPERALGSLSSGTNSPAFGVAIVNNTGATINSVSISYTGEYWRSSTSSTATPNTLTFGYEVGAANSATYLTSATASANPLLDLPGPVPVAANAALNGNSIANQIPRAGVLTNLNWQNGDSLYIRWSDVDDQGSDAGLAVDDFSLSVVPEPTSLALFVFAGLMLAASRRRAA